MLIPGRQPVRYFSDEGELLKQTSTRLIHAEIDYKYFFVLYLFQSMGY